jgi:hypothetical protein
MVADRRGFESVHPWVANKLCLMFEAISRTLAAERGNLMTAGFFPPCAVMRNRVQ